jgi:hypothetical protein
MPRGRKPSTAYFVTYHTAGLTLLCDGSVYLTQHVAEAEARAMGRGFHVTTTLDGVIVTQPALETLDEWQQRETLKAIARSRKRIRELAHAYRHREPALPQYVRSLVVQ